MWIERVEHIPREILDCLRNIFRVRLRELIVPFGIFMSIPVISDSQLAPAFRTGSTAVEMRTIVPIAPKDLLQKGNFVSLTPTSDIRSDTGRVAGP